MKQVTRRILALVLVLSMVPAMAAEATESRAAAAYFDFEADEVGQAPTGWTVTTTANSSAADTWCKVVADPTDEENKVMAVNAMQTKFEAFAQTDIPVIDGEALVSLRIYFPAENALPNSAGVHFFAAGQTSPSVSLMNDGSGLGHRPGTSATTTKQLAKLEVGRWYTVEVRLNAVTKTYAVWLDGKCLVEGATFRNALTPVSAIRVAAPKSYNGAIYADDITVHLGAAQKITAVSPVEAKEVPVGASFAGLDLPETVEVTLDNGETALIPVQWDESAYQADLLGEQTIPGVLLTGALYENDRNLTASALVTVQESAVARDVASVEAFDAVTAKLGTAEADLDLPAEAAVVLTDDVNAVLAISDWTCTTTYDRNEAAEYVFEGALEETDLVKNPLGLKAEIHVWLGGDEFDQLREKWYYQIAGSNDFDESDEDVAAYVEYLGDSADDILGRLVAVDGHDYDAYYNAFMKAHMVFTDCPMTAQNKTGSSQRTMTYDHLKSLALAYRIKGAKYFGSAEMRDLIVAAMDFMYDDNKYSTTSGSVGNWYDWEIGTPLRYLDLLVLMYEELDAQQIQKFTASVDHYSSVADTLTGANRIWKCSVVAENAILSKNAEKLASVAPAVKKEMKYVTSSDGFYEDGSFIQHTSYPYTGGYGKAFIVVMAPMMSVLSGTDYAIRYEDGAEQIFLNAVFQSYEPFLINGGVMDMVRNREISRASGQDNVAGRQVMRAIMALTDAMEGEQKERALSMVKYFLEEDDRHYIFNDELDVEFPDGKGLFLEYYVGLNHILQGKEILADETIQSRGPLTGYFKFPSMARAAQHTENYAMGLAMCGWNTKTYEVVNEEGKNMWHTADGMLYLYNADKDKYAGDFWGTVDHQRLPGTTVDRFTKGSSYRSGATNGSSVVGGTDLMGRYGATAFEISNGAHAKKSYFMFDDEAVLLGADISSTSGHPVETIVENYKAKLDLSNRVSVDGVEQILGAEAEKPQPIDYKTLRIASNTVGKNITARMAVAEQTAGTLTLEFDAMFPKNENFLSVSLVSGSALVTQLIVRDSCLAYRVSTSGSGQDGVAAEQALTAGQWHHVKLVVDLDKQEAHYYLDGKQMTAATNHITGEKVDLTNANLLMANAKVDGILLGTPNGGVGAGHYDDLTLKNGDTVLFSDNFDNGADGQAPEGWVKTATDAAGEFCYATVSVQPETPAREDTFSGSHKNVSYIHMEGNVSGSDVGYVFPGGADVTGLRETRTQKWTLMNSYEKFYTDADKTNSFITMYLDHGTNPVGDTYSYILLPGKTEAETAAYSADSDVEILANNAQVQAVREKTLGITAVNFFTAADCAAAGVSADLPASVMYGKDAQGDLVVSVSDVTNKASGEITVTLNFPVEEVVSGGEHITLERAEDKTVLKVNVDGSRGQTRTVTVKIPEIHTHVFDQKNTDPKFQKSTATCTEAAVYYYSCSCGEKDTKTFTSGTALGHDYKAVVTAPTCEDKGYTTHTCSRCGHSYVDGEVAALGHDYKDEVTAPTCEDKGYTTHTCSRCGHSYVDGEVEALGHEYESVVTAPTCEDKGYTTHTCSRCGDSYVDTYVEALGHKGGAATCKHKAVCEICGKAYGELDPSNHEGPKVIHNQMDPTTEHDGYTGDVYCGACGKLIEKGEVIDKLPEEKPENPFIPNRPAPVKPVGPTAPAFPFTDVHENDWFYDSVKSAWENDLVDGVSATKYAPNETLTVASAIKLAAALHQMDNDGYVSLKNGAPVWYSTYVDYAVENGVIEESYLQYTAAQMNAPVTRAEFIHIFYGAMDNYDEINDVKDDHIPDVKMTDKYADEIYTFYRAGILTGCDSKGSCRPATVITRGEVAAILIRMYDVTARVRITL